MIGEKGKELGHDNESLPSSLSAHQDQAGSESRSRPSTATILGFIALCLSIFLVALDTVLIPTALPYVSTSFRVSDSLYAWVGSAYLLANGASVPFWGKLSDIFGRKPIILSANTIFLAASLMCALSVNAEMLVAGRVLQGLGGGGVVVMVHVCVSDLFDIRDRSYFLGIVGAVWAVASALGPVLGGIFAEHISWRWCFYLNLPIISVSILTLFFTLRLSTTRTPLLIGLLSMDWIGTGTIVAAAVFLLVGLQSGSTTSFVTPAVLTFIVLGCVLSTAFPLTQWWEEKRGREPILPLRIFKDFSNLSALSVCACDALAFNSVAYFLPLYLQIVLQQNASITGVYMLAIAIPLAAVSFVSGYVIEKTGRFLEVLQAGLLLMTIGVGLLVSLSAELETGKTIAILIVIGLGFGPNFSAPLIALQTRIRDSDIATGTSAFGFVRMISGAIGVVVGQVVFQLLMGRQSDTFLKNGIPSDIVAQLTRGEATSLRFTLATLPHYQQRAATDGLGKAMRGTWVFYTVVSALGLVVSFGIKRTKLHRGNISSNSEIGPL
ncbi:major facilitator superfamily domain-containing protein [Paraphoma chrysanthemicola]|uniref:Major facilitator superfamily domain-containing protein n=1 Tax=Paraphoma chrysanthemicola TaxID=798071 RepID=A0A8K0RFN6_9PLEO|nr:major facilitator superfamily domain-containing protein [Paraphoma chrysanthemicola]